MFISKSNAIRNLTPTIREGAGTDLPSNMVNPDFSVSYTAGDTRLVISLGAISSIDYVAIAGINFGAGTGRVVVRDGQSTATNDARLGQYNVERDHVLMFNFERRNFTYCIIVIDTERANVRPTINLLAAGQAIQVPNGGETAGYSYNSLTRPIESRTTGNDNAAPVANLIKRVALRGNLTLPNMTREFALTEWQQFYDYAVRNPFFICEQATNALTPDRLNDAWRSYVCFNPQFNAPKAHAMTRALMDLSLGFSCYNGL